MVYRELGGYRAECGISIKPIELTKSMKEIVSERISSLRTYVRSYPLS